MWHEKTNTNVVWADKYKLNLGRQIKTWFGQTNTKVGREDKYKSGLVRQIKSGKRRQIQM